MGNPVVTGFMPKKCLPIKMALGRGRGLTAESLMLGGVTGPVPHKYLQMALPVMGVA
jgi:hypothetical protein